MNRKINHLIFNDDIFSKIAYLKKVDNNKRPFVASKQFGDEASFLLEQIVCHEKAKYKLPYFLAKNCLFTSLSIAQATSELVAAHKAKYIYNTAKHKKQLYSLTAGLGVDDYYLSQYFEKITALDTDELLNSICNFNLIQLGVKNITRQNMACEDYLEGHKITSSTIYLDPDRRAIKDASNKMVEKFSPNILTIVPELLANNNEVFIKLPGIIDLTWLSHNIKNIKTITIWNHTEVKEILVHVAPNASEPVILVNDVKDALNYSVIDEKVITDIQHSILGNGSYIFHPIPGIIKSGILPINPISLSNNAPFYFTNNLNLLSYGKLYQINTKLEISLKQLKQYLKKNKINAASITARNFKLNSNECKAFLGLKEYDNLQIFIFENQSKLTTFICDRVW